uniref:Uncharacterized protein n=1 Tax=Zooxanthella nutricula TaxID=1333877 RepID=A0A7S2JQA1_9DINO
MSPLVSRALVVLVLSALPQGANARAPRAFMAVRKVGDTANARSDAPASPIAHSASARIAQSKPSAGAMKLPAEHLNIIDDLEGLISRREQALERTSWILGALTLTAISSAALGAYAFVGDDGSYSKAD